MQPEEEGGLKVLADGEILEAMQEYAEEVLIAYILTRTGCASKFEANRAAEMFFELEPF